MATIAVLALATAGTAGASTHSTGTKAAIVRAEKYFTCADVQRRANFLRRMEARFTKGFAYDNAMEAKAQKDHDTYLIGYWQQTLAKQKKDETHLVGYWRRSFSKQGKYDMYLLKSHRMTRQVQRAKAAETKCQVVVPKAPSSMSTTTSTTKASTTTSQA
ncbi:MAG TPA: hypothetical protein VN816_09365 [Acidimicrobiales bacterium]|nr:hypothetical protein [Acidimicrobiales bacterium]